MYKVRLDDPRFHAVQCGIKPANLVLDEGVDPALNNAQLELENLRMLMAGIGLSPTPVPILEDVVEFALECEGPYGGGVYSGRYGNGHFEGAGIWECETKGLKGEGTFFTHESGWMCFGKLTDTKANQLVFDGRFACMGMIQGKHYLPEGVHDGSVHDGLFKDNKRHGRTYINTFLQGFYIHIYRLTQIHSSFNIRILLSIHPL